MPPSTPSPPTERERQGSNQAQSDPQVIASRVPIKEPHQTPNSKGPARALNGRSSGRASGSSTSMAMETNSRPSDHLDRVSHDLSYSQGHGASNSLVENMLTSLDQFSGGPRNTGASVDMNTPMTADERRLYTSFRDDPSQSFSSSLRFNLFKQGRRRGHTHSSSRSSDYEANAITRPTTQSSHGRKTYNASTRQSSLAKIESINGRGRIESQRAAPPLEKTGPIQNRGSLGSKGECFFERGFYGRFENGCEAVGRYGAKTTDELGSYLSPTWNSQLTNICNVWSFERRDPKCTCSIRRLRRSPNSNNPWRPIKISYTTLDITISSTATPSTTRYAADTTQAK